MPSVTYAQRWLSLSLLQALFRYERLCLHLLDPLDAPNPRMVEVKEGAIEIDGLNIRNIGLDVLRRQLALVPQDSTLFLGTLRENL